MSTLSSPIKMLTRALIILASAGAASACAQPASFRGLGDLPGGDVYSTALGISRDGRAIVGSSVSLWSAAGEEAVRWDSRGAALPLGQLNSGSPSAWSEAWAASSGGAVVVGMSGSSSTDTASPRAFRWTKASGMVPLGVLAGATQSRAYGVSDDGSVIVGYSGLAMSGLRAFRWTAQGGMAALPLPAIFAWNVSADGLVVAGYGGPTGAYLWTEAAGLVSLPLPGGATSSDGALISPDGTVAVGQAVSVGQQEAFRWSAAEGAIGLGDLAGGVFASYAWGTSAEGMVIIGQATTAVGSVPMIWDRAHGIRELRLVLEQEFGLGAVLAGWTLKQVNGISADGRTLVGYGIDPGGFTEGWVAVFGYGCYPNCDSSTSPPVLNVADFSCFLTRFSLGDPYANCDGSTVPPVLNVNDFSCFMNKFAAGCS